MKPDLTTLTRSARLVGAGLAGLRVRLARSPEVRERARAHAARRLGRLRGLPQKVGQLLSLREEGGEAFEGLREAAEPLPLADLLPLAEEAWGRPAQEVLAEVEPEVAKNLTGLIDGEERITLHTSAKVSEIKGKVGDLTVSFTDGDGKEQSVSCDRVLMATGKRPRPR